MSYKESAHIFDEIDREDFLNKCIYSKEMKDCPFLDDMELLEDVEMVYTTIKIKLLDHYIK
jgi:hypothetical protein